MSPVVRHRHQHDVVDRHPAVLEVDIQPEGKAEGRVDLAGGEHRRLHPNADVLDRHLRHVDVVELGEQRPLRKRSAHKRRTDLLVLELLGFGDAAALARNDGVRRLVVDHEYCFDRRRWMLVAILDERVDIGKGHLMAAVCDAGDRFERRGGIVDGQVQPLVLEITPVLGEKEQRFRSFQAPVEREFDGGLRSGGPSSDERERCREQIGGSVYPFKIEEAHGLPYSLYRSSAPASPGRIRG